MITNFSGEWLGQRIVADSLDAILFADQEGVIRLWNAGAAEMFG
jgi:PAS domain-containing protein